MSVAYHDASWIGVRFFDHFQFATRKDIGNRDDFPPNLLEQTGSLGLWITQEIPKKIIKKLSDPRIVSLALTVSALALTSFGFYPISTIHAIRHAIALLPHVPFWAVKFAAYIAVCETIISYGLRAQGRFWNHDLTQAFYANKL